MSIGFCGFYNSGAEALRDLRRAAAALHQSPQQGGGQLHHGESQPDPGDAEAPGEEAGNEDNAHAAPEGRESAGRSGPLGGAEEGRRQVVIAHAEEAHKIEPQALFRQALEQGIALAVEPGDQGGGGQQSGGQNGQPHPAGEDQSLPQEGSRLLPVPPPIGPAEQGLDALGHACKDGEHHQGQVGHDAVGGHAGAAGGLQEQQVEDHQYHAGGAFVDAGGETGTDIPSQLPEPETVSGQMEPGPAGDNVERGDGQADDRGETGGQGGAEEPHVQGVDEEVVQGDVGQAPRQHVAHGQPGVAVVAEEGHKEVVEDEAGRKAEDGLQIGGTQREKVTFRPQRPGDGLRPEEAAQRKHSPAARALRRAAVKTRSAPAPSLWERKMV